MGTRIFNITAVTCLCIFLSFSTCHAQDSANDRHIEVSLRMIGHQLLLSNNDSTARVLPITKIDDRYRIQFEDDFEFEPGNLSSTIDRVVKETRLAKSYIVEVQECETNKVIYSYKVDDIEQSDIIPCQGRMQSKACYSLWFTLIETRWANTALLTDVEDSTNSLDAGSNKVNYGLIAALLILMASLIYFAWKRRALSKLDPNMIPMGDFHFDKRNAELLIGEQKIELTSKESDLLQLLYKDANNTVERDVILNMVWGDEGDYVGRTLDVFISKLRKKLEADSHVKIVNVRGVGYKLVMDV